MPVSLTPLHSVTDREEHGNTSSCHYGNTEDSLQHAPLQSMSQSGKANGPLRFVFKVSNILKNVSSNGYHEKPFCNHCSY